MRACVRVCVIFFLPFIGFKKIIKKIKYFIVPCGKFWSPYPGMALQPRQEQDIPIGVCSSHTPLCVDSGVCGIFVWLPVFGK